MQIYRTFVPGWLALTLAVILVVLSQIKINVTNAYSLAGVDQFIHTAHQALSRAGRVS